MRPRRRSVKEEMVREKKNEAFYETYSEYAAKVHLARDDSLWKNLSITDGEKTSADFFARDDM